ncbi:MAG: hypothetical protein FVQ82_05125 [Planctomycetes bacterium]|nr:hypothetical protein [Planctomycetota bacterium]
MIKIERKPLICSALLVMAMTVPAFASLAPVTVATFADPSDGSAEFLFTIDYDAGTLSGGWSGTGLTLEIPIADVTYENATFTIDDITFVSGGSAGSGYDTSVGPYGIHFFDGATEVLTIEYKKAWIKSRTSGLDAQDFYGDDVTISGVDFGELSAEHFSFAFTNIVYNGDSYNATASFTSSAIPEPATIVILAFGSLFMRNCRR